MKREKRICVAPDCSRAALSYSTRCGDHLAAFINSAFAPASRSGDGSLANPPSPADVRPQTEPPVSRTVALSRVDAR